MWWALSAAVWALVLALVGCMVAERILLERGVRLQEVSSARVQREGDEYVLSCVWRVYGSRLPWHWDNMSWAKKTWTFRAQLRVPAGLYRTFVGRSHAVSSPHDYTKFFDNGPFIREVAENLLALAPPEFGPLDRAAFLLAFVGQGIAYMSDRVSTGWADWPKYPVETLADGCGDCEDMAILFASLAEAAGLNAVLVYFERENLAHMGAAIEVPPEPSWIPWDYEFQGKHYLYCEATDPLSRFDHVGWVSELFEGKTPLILQVGRG
jgi:transglutaminase-like putative cysteine protease